MTSRRYYRRRGVNYTSRYQHHVSCSSLPGSGSGSTTRHERRERAFAIACHVHCALPCHEPFFLFMAMGGVLIAYCFILRTLRVSCDVKIYNSHACRAMRNVGPPELARCASFLRLARGRNGNVFFFADPRSKTMFLCRPKKTKIAVTLNYRRVRRPNFSKIEALDAFYMSITKHIL